MIKGADHRAEDRAFATIQTSAADDDRRDYIELGTGRDGRITLSQTRHLHHTRQTKQQSRQTIDPDL